MPRPRVDLPDSDEPLDTPNGPVAPVSIQRRKLIEIPSNREAVAVIEGTRRKLAELPLAPRHLNPIACICLYTLYGLDAQEISVATGLNLEQIHAIRMSNEYGMMQKAVVDTVLQQDTGEVKDFIKKAANIAAQKVESLVHHQNPDVALRASKDVLDRAGLRPADVVEVRGRMDLGLVIEVVDRQDDEGRPVIDMEK